LNAEGKYFPALEQAIKEMKQKYSVDRLREQENAALYNFDTYYKGPLMIISNNIESRNMALVKIFRNNRSSSTYVMQDLANIKEISDAEFPDGHPSVLGHQIYAKEIYEYIVNQQVICR